MLDRTLGEVDQTATADPLVGQLLDGRYRVGSRIARGGMATVYKGLDLRLDRRVALKVVPGSLAADTDFTQRFVREARSAARLSHPGIVSVYDQGEDEGLLFLVMEYVEGGRTLRDLIRAEAPMRPQAAMELLDGLVEAVAAAHESGIIHRDLKPENVLLDPLGRIKVTDFGLARAISSATTATATSGILMGTVSYLPPELVTEGTADARADVYSLGVITFELLTGSKPHAGESPIQVAYKHVHDDVPPPSTRQPGLPPYLDAFVSRATARQRDLRPADAYVMLRQLRRVRHALEHHVTDDPELTDDLTPTVAIDTEVTRPVEAQPESVFLPPSPRPDVDEVFDQEAYDAPAPPPPWEPTSVVPNAATPPPQQPTAPSTPTRRRRRRTRGLIAFLVVLALAIGAGVVGWYFGVGRFRVTPDVMSLTQSAAKHRLADAGLSLRITGNTYSETVPAGRLVSTDPGPGARIVKGGTVNAVVSKGPERHKVPDLDGMSAPAARRAIKEHALNVGDVSREWSDQAKKGTVIRFEPEAGKPLKRNADVSLVISKGPEPITIEDYTGEDADDAKEALSEAGFTVDTSTAFNDHVEEGDVVSQQPAHGTGHRGDTVHLVISRGPHLVEVPSVRSYGIEDAKEALENAGFDVEVEHNSPYFGLGFVVKQDPGGGDKAPRGATITLYIV